MAIFNVNSYSNNGYNVLDILDEAVYLNQEVVLNTESVPIAESDELGGYLIRFSDLETISENYGVDYIDATIGVCEANGIDPRQALIVVDESELIVNPYLINELDNVIVNPQPENSLAYQFCESCIEAWANTGDEGYLEFMLDEETTIDIVPEGEELPKPTKAQGRGTLGRKAMALGKKLQRKATRGLSHARDSVYDAYEWVKANPKYAGGAAAGTAAVAGLGYLAHKKGLFGKAKTGAYHLVGKQTPEEIQQLERIKQEAANKPKSWIGKKIAALRSMYAKYKQKADQEKAAGTAGVFTKIASAILNCIDWLMNKLQHMAG